MNLIQALILGAVQGATEFLPISSSGHLVLVPWLLGWDFDPKAAFVFDVLVQWGTIVAVIGYFWRDLFALARAWLVGLWKRQPFADPQSRLAWLLLLATLPAAVLGLLLKSTVENTFGQPLTVSFFLLVTAGLLYFAERGSRPFKSMSILTWSDSLWIGMAQALSLFPGISRSGATISGGLFRGLEREQAARFSFLLSVPAMLGAGLIALIDLSNASNAMDQAAPLLVGFLAAIVTGWIAIHWLLRFLQHRRLYIFSIYCTVVALGGIALYALRN
ncbi:MAG: undecaprenyl-diphosphatase UppP [Anaerolineales bacterium]|nr:undecaprenyl-diphosphatase UppP [Anaerolineales bacterium]